MELWPTILLAGLLTYGTRLSFIAAHGRVEMPGWFTRALSFVPVAMLSAIIFPDILAPHNTLDLAPGNPRLIAGMAATLVAWRTRSIWLTIAVGMVVLFAMQVV